MLGRLGWRPARVERAGPGSPRVDPKASTAASHGNPYREFLERMYDGRSEPFPLAQQIGLEFLELERGRAVLALSMDERFHNPMGVVHGGVIFGLLDTAMGFAATTLLEGKTWAGTVDVKVSFLRSVSDGRVRAEGRVVRQGRTVLHLEAKAWDDAGELIAQALGTALVVEDTR